MMGPQDFSMGRQYDFRTNLSFQINRIAEILSAKVDTTQASNYMQAMQVLVNAKLNSVDTLEAMLYYYLDRDDEYKKAIAEAEKNFVDAKNDGRSIENIITKEEFAEKKFALIMQFMGRKRWLIEETATADEGFSETEELRELEGGE